MSCLFVELEYSLHDIGDRQDLNRPNISPRDLLAVNATVLGMKFFCSTIVMRVYQQAQT